MTMNTKTNEITLDQFIDRTIYKNYDTEYGDAFKYLLRFDANSTECVVPIEMLIKLTGMRPFNLFSIEQKLKELGFAPDVDYIKTESRYLINLDTFIKYLKRTDEGKCFVDEYYNLLETVVHKYLQYQQPMFGTANDITTIDLKSLTKQLNNIDNNLIQLRMDQDNLRHKVAEVAVSNFIWQSVASIIIVLVAIGATSTYFG